MTDYCYYHNTPHMVFETAVPRDGWDFSLRNCLKILREGLVYQGRKPVEVEEALEVLMDPDNFILLIGGTWIAAFEVGTPWMSTEKFLCEEFVGPRNGHEMDFEDFVRGATVLAKHLGADVLEFGTRTNPRHAAMARLSQRLGAKVSAVTLSKEIR